LPDHLRADQSVIVVTLAKLNLHAVRLYLGITELETSARSLCTLIQTDFYTILELGWHDTRPWNTTVLEVSNVLAALTQFVGRQFHDDPVMISI